MASNKQKIAPIFGNGSDGSATVSSNSNWSDLIGTGGYKSCSGNAGDEYVTVAAGDESSFVAGKRALIIQMRGTGVAQYEEKIVESNSSGQINFIDALDNTYTDSGASQAQIFLMPQYTNLTINTGITLSANAWTGDIGGGIVLCCNSLLTITGTISTAGLGYLGSNTAADDFNIGGQGEGSVADRGTRSTSANGNGGGGSSAASGGTSKPSGGGGGHGIAGDNGANGDFTGGTGGLQVGVAALTTLFMGGGGGGAYYDGSGGNRMLGNPGGGFIYILAKKIVVTGGVSANGDSTTGSGGTNVSGGGGGAGGSILIVTEDGTFGTNLITAAGGTGRVGVGNGTSGGNGAYGRIRLEVCRRTGSTNNPSASEAVGGRPFCGSIASILG